MGLRAGAAWGLGKLHDSRAVEPLIQLLRDKKKMVRLNAIWALGNIDDNRAITGLSELLRDEDPEIREAVGKALALLKSLPVKKPDADLHEEKQSIS